MSTDTHTIRRGRLGWCVALVALGLAFLAAIPARGGPASAELSQAGLLAFDAGRFHDIGGPRFAGESVVWSEPDTRNGGYRLVRGLADGSVLELARFDAFARAIPSTVVAASSTQVFVYQTLASSSDPLSEPTPDSGTVRLTGGGLEQVGPAARASLDVSGDAAIFPADNLDVTIRDFGPSPTPTRTVRADGPVSIAGRYAAWGQGADVVVYDWRAGTEAYRVGDVVDGSFDVESVDVQDDGKVAFSYEVLAGDSLPSRVGWASPSEPFVHRVALPEALAYSVRLAGDTIAYARGPAGLPTARAELGVTGLSGGALTLVRPIEGGGDVFDFDGTRLAWQTRTCAGPKVSVASVAELTARPRLGRLPRCPLVIRNRPRVTRSGHVALRFDCTGLAVGCAYRALRIRTARRERLGDRRIRKGRSIAFRFGPGPTLARVRLNRLGRRLARKRGPLRVVVKVDRGDNSYLQRRQAKISLR